MSNTITIELCAEDRARLDAILKALVHQHDCNSRTQMLLDHIKKIETATNTATEDAEQPQEPAKAPSQPVTPPEEEKPAEAAPAEFPIGETPFDEPEPSEPEQEAAKVDRADVQRLVVDLSAAGKKTEVKEIVMAYADRVSAIPEDKLAEVFEKLNKLGG